jgi:hypothetical protein
MLQSLVNINNSMTEVQGKSGAKPALSRNCMLADSE